MFAILAEALPWILGGVGVAAAAGTYSGVSQGTASASSNGFTLLEVGAVVVAVALLVRK